MVIVVSIVELTVVAAISYKTYKTTKRVWGNVRTLALKFLTIISYNIWRVPRVRRATVDLANFFSLSLKPYIVFTRSLYATWGERILYIQTYYIGEYTTVAYMQVQVVAVVVVVVRGCENSFTGYLRGMCRISNVSRISIVWRPCILCTYIYARYTRVWWILYTFFSTYLWRIADDGAGVRYTYIRTYGMYSEVDHYYRNLTLIERKKRKMYVCI